MTAEDLAKLFVKEITRSFTWLARLNGQRRVKFLAQILSLLYISSHMTTAWRPNANGLVERIKQTLEAYLRAFVSYRRPSTNG